MKTFEIRTTAPTLLAGREYAAGETVGRLELDTDANPRDLLSLTVFGTLELAEPEGEQQPANSGRKANKPRRRST